VNISPTLPNPQPPAQPQKRTAVAAVNAAQPTRDAADEPSSRPPVKRVVDESRTTQIQASTDAVATPDRAHSAHVSRALAVYARVAGDGERRSLHDVLGFDEYA
jgi:hypothetical protein